MIYSVQNQYQGHFDYYEVPDTIATNDDQPVPTFDSSIVTKLGVPAILAGRPLPPGAGKVGSGRVAKGKVSTGRLGTEKGGKLMLGPDPDGMGELPTFYKPTYSSILFAVGGVLIGFGIVRWLKE